MLLGVDVIQEEKIETVATALKERRNNRRKEAKEEVKLEDLETALASKGDHSNEEEPISINSSRYPFLVSCGIESCA